MVTQLSYRVQAAGNQNGTRSHGEAFLAARGARNVDLGIRAVSGVGTIDVSALYGGVPIMRIDITAAGDAQRTDRLTFTIAPEAAVNLVSLRGFGTVRATEYDVCDLLISGSHDIRLAAVGLGIASADPPSLLDSVLEGSEFSRFEFATAFTSVPYVNEAAIDNDSDGVLAESFVEAYGASGDSLGIVPVSGEGEHDVPDLFGGAAISAFRLIADGDGQRIAGLARSPEPGPLARGLTACAVLALVARRRRADGARRRRRRPGVGSGHRLRDRRQDAHERVPPARTDAGEITFRGQFAGGFGIFTPHALVAEMGQSVGSKTIVTIAGPAILEAEVSQAVVAVAEGRPRRHRARSRAEAADGVSGPQRGERPGDAIECRRTSETGHSCPESVAGTARPARLFPRPRACSPRPERPSATRAAAAGSGTTAR